jgi:hypothetical protein
MKSSRRRRVLRMPPGPSDRRTGCVRLASSALLLACSIGFSRPMTADAQVLRGRVVEQDSRAGVAQASLIAISAAGDTSRAVTTDATGAFLLHLDGPGRHGVRVEHARYRGFMTAPIEVAVAEEVALELRLAPATVEATPVTILGRRRVAIDDYEGRVAFMRRLDMGRFLGEAEIDSLRASVASEVLSGVPGVVVTPSPEGPVTAIASAAGSCAPAIFVDGLSTRSVNLDRILPPDLIAAVEVYRGAVETPSEFADPGGCGVILLWTRRGDERSVPWRRAVVYVGMIAISIVLFAR